MPLPPEVQAQLAEQKKQCVFCKILSKEVPGKLVFEDSKTAALLDIYPAIKGHTLSLPKEHYPILPYLPPEDFKALFGTLPALCKAVKGALITTALNIFIANGGAAGQQAPHFLVHLFPRDPGDGFFNFLWKQKKNSLPEDKLKLLAQNFTAIMQDHFQKNPAPWHAGKGTLPEFLKKIADLSIILYEDEKVLVILPKDSAIPGQIEIYSKTEESFLEKLSPEDSLHLFTLASFAASLLFQILEAQGTNLIAKSGKTDDHLSGKLCLYVLPRRQGDGLESMMWKPAQPNYDLDAVAEKIKDKTWKIKEEKKNEIPLTINKPEVRKISEDKIAPPKESSPHDEIRAAIKKMQKN